MYDFINNWSVHTPDKPWSETMVRQLDPRNGGMAGDIHEFIRVNYLRKGPFNYTNSQYQDKWRVAIVGKKGKGQGSHGGRNHLYGVVCAQSCKFAFQYQRDGPFTAFL